LLLYELLLEGKGRQDVLKYVNDLREGKITEHERSTESSGLGLLINQSQDFLKKYLFLYLYEFEWEKGGETF
jgi:hypothetical protein